MDINGIAAYPWARQVLANQSSMAMPVLTNGLLGNNALGSIAAGASNGAQAMAGQAQQANEAAQQANANLQNKQMQQQAANASAIQQLGVQPSRSAQNGNTLGKMLKLAMAIYGGGAGTAGTIAAGAPTAAKTLTIGGTTLGL